VHVSVLLAGCITNILSKLRE